MMVVVMREATEGGTIHDDGGGDERGQRGREYLP